MLWYDGRLIAEGSVAFDLADRGLLLGDGLFETLPAFNTVPFRLDAHIDRIIRSAVQLGMPLIRQQLEEAVLALAKLDPSPCVIRLSVTRGSGPRGLLPPKVTHPLVFATRAIWNPTSAFGHSSLAISAIRRNPTSPTSSMKTLAYLDSVMGFQEAQAKGADDALFLSPNGSIACTSMANLFILNHNSLVTPALDGSVLPGITRQLIIDIAPRLGLSLSEKNCSIGDLMAADLVFSTNSVRFISLITHLDGQTLSTKAMVTGRKLSSALADQVRQECNGFVLKAG